MQVGKVCAYFQTIDIGQGERIGGGGSAGVAVGQKGEKVLQVGKVCADGVGACVALLFEVMFKPQEVVHR